MVSNECTNIHKSPCTHLYNMRGHNNVYRQADGQTNGETESNTPPLNSVCKDLIKMAIKLIKSSML